jgi:hypothetical protein
MNSTAQPSHSTLTADNLREAPLAELLLYGLTLGDDDPALGVLQGARRELGLVASLAERCRLRTDVDLAELVPVMESIGRRLDVAIELFARAQPASAPEPPAEPKEASAP